MVNEIDIGPGNRQARRFAAKLAVKLRRQVADSTPVRPQTTASLLNREDDLPLYISELELSAKMERRQRLQYADYQIHRQVGATEETYRQYLICSLPGQDLYHLPTVTAQMLSEIDSTQIRYLAPRIQSMATEMKRLNIRFDPNDEETRDDLLLLTDRNIPLKDLFLEGIRSRHEINQLLRMQIEYLKDQKKQAKIEARQKLRVSPQLLPEISKLPLDSIEEEKVEVSPQVPAEETQPFVLSGWDLFWTARHWSTEPNHLIQIPTSSRNDALEVFEPISRGEITIKPGSIIRALEMHMSKDIIQQALATRLKYGPEERRGWIKIKRGGVRILLSVPGNHQAIFFAGNRDNIYR